MKKLFWLSSGGLVLLLLACWPRAAEAAPPAGGVVGSGTAGTCTQSALHARLQGGGVVSFNCGGAATIVLSTTEVISLNTTILGGSVITLSGGSVTSIFDIEGGAVTVSDLTLANGFNEGGGAIYHNQGQLTVNNSRFVNNTAIAYGGAILANSGPLTVTHSDFYSNTAGAAGGAVYAIGNVTVSDSTFEFNQAQEAGAILYNTQAGRSAPAGAGPQFTLESSRFFSNTATNGRGGALLNFGVTTIRGSDFELSQSRQGGALHNALNASLTLQNSQFLSNTAPAGAGGAILNLGQLLVSDSTFTSNSAPDGGRGGAIALDPAASALVASSTFTGNIAVIGGGLVTSGSLTLRNTTLAANGAFVGGALLVAPEALTTTLTNNTLADNNALGGGAILNGGSALVLLKNNILASQLHNNCQGALTSLGHNLDDANTCALTASGDLTNTAPLLGPLASNGGPTQTMALLPGSPAINHGDNNGCPAADQRGFFRIAGCDIGAFEYAYRLLLPVLKK